MRGKSSCAKAQSTVVAKPRTWDLMLPGGRGQVVPKTDEVACRRTHYF